MYLLCEPSLGTDGEGASYEKVYHLVQGNTCRSPQDVLCIDSVCYTDLSFVPNQYLVPGRTKMLQRWPAKQQIYYVSVWFGAVLTAVIPGLLLSHMLHSAVFSASSFALQIWHANAALEVVTVRTHWLLAFTCAMFCGLLVGLTYYTLILKDVFPTAKWWIWAGAGVTVFTYLSVLSLYVS